MSMLKLFSKKDKSEKTKKSDVSGTLTITDERTGKQYEVEVSADGVVNGSALAVIKDDDGNPLKLFDPGYLNTAWCRSNITFIDGEKGILRYRGYQIEDLCEKSSFLEVAYLLIYGDLPGKNQLQEWQSLVMKHTFIHEDMLQFLKNFRYDAHPMGMLVSSLAAMSTFHPDANPALQDRDLYSEQSVRDKQIVRIIGKVATVAACAYRHRIGRPYTYPDTSQGLDYAENFLYMLDKLSEHDYKPHPRLAKALDVLFIIHADHELNCSTAAMRHLASTRVDPYTGVSGAASALYGPLHGGANEAVLRMLEDIKTVENIPQFLEDVKNKKKMLMGFGHRIYKNYDPRATILKKYTDEIFDILGRDPLMEVASALEKAALSDEYFIKRKLYPNVDFYSGVIYRTMGFPTDMFPILFAIPRTVGWLAHWAESLTDPDCSRVVRPQQIYTGPKPRAFVEVKSRRDSVQPQAGLSMYRTNSQASKRRSLSVKSKHF